MENLWVFFFYMWPQKKKNFHILTPSRKIFWFQRCIHGQYIISVILFFIPLNQEHAKRPSGPTSSTVSLFCFLFCVCARACAKSTRSIWDDRYSLNRGRSVSALKPYEGKGGFQNAYIPGRTTAVGWRRWRRLYGRMMGISVGSGFCVCWKIQRFCVFGWRSKEKQGKENTGKK